MGIDPTLDHGKRNFDRYLDDRKIRSNGYIKESEVKEKRKKSNKQILCLKSEVRKLKEKIKAAENCLVCAAIADPMEVIENTMGILKGE